MVIDAVLNAIRISFSFFLLLIVCMGYGVVKPSLGRTMIYVRILAITHFIFAVIYDVASLSITPDTAGPLVLLIVLPLAGTLTAFYVWTLNSLNTTTKDLVNRKQKVKALMYKKLWWCILGSVIVIFGFFFLNSFAFAGRIDAGFAPERWKTRWFVLDGWLNLVYLFDLAFVAYLWRPTFNNRRFAMSDEVCAHPAPWKVQGRDANALLQIAQDDEGFEIRSFGTSLDEERGFPNEDIPIDENGRDLSPVPPKPVPSAPRQRESLDGETIFAVGGDADKWSDEEEEESPRNSGERTRLNAKDD